MIIFKILRLFDEKVLMSVLQRQEFVFKRSLGHWNHYIVLKKSSCLKPSTGVRMVIYNVLHIQDSNRLYLAVLYPPFLQIPNTSSLHLFTNVIQKLVIIYTQRELACRQLFI